MYDRQDLQRAEEAGEVLRRHGGYGIVAEIAAMRECSPLRACRAQNLQGQAVKHGHRQLRQQVVAQISATITLRRRIEALGQT